MNNKIFNRNNTKLNFARTSNLTNKKKTEAVYVRNMNLHHLVIAEIEIAVRHGVG